MADKRANSYVRFVHPQFNRQVPSERRWCQKRDKVNLSLYARPFVFGSMPLLNHKDLLRTKVSWSVLLFSLMLILSWLSFLILLGDKLDDTCWQIRNRTRGSNPLILNLNPTLKIKTQ